MCHPGMERPQLRTANARRTAVGAASQVRLAYLALRRATDPGVVAVLRARVDYPDDTLAQVGARLGLTKDVYSARLRRALTDATSTTRRPPEPPPPPLRAGQPSPRSARAIRIGIGKRPS